MTGLRQIRTAPVRSPGHGDCAGNLYSAESDVPQTSATSPKSADCRGIAGLAVAGASAFGVFRACLPPAQAR